MKFLKLKFSTRAVPRAEFTTLLQRDNVDIPSILPIMLQEKKKIALKMLYLEVNR